MRAGLVVVRSGRSYKKNKPGTINFERLEQAFDESGLGGLVAASTYCVLYLSRASVHYAPGWERMWVVVWPRWGWSSLVVPSDADGLAKETTWLDDVRTCVDRVQCVNYTATPRAYGVQDVEADPSPHASWAAQEVGLDIL